MTNAYGVYQDYYVRHFLTNYSPSTIGWIGSVQLFWQFFSGIIAGRLFDAGYFHHMMIGASTLYVFAYFMLSLAKEQQFYQVFLAQGIAAGIGLGFLFLPSIGVIAHHFRRRRSFAMGVVVSGSSCGGLVFPVMLK
jgi:MFS family permease